MSRASIEHRLTAVEEELAKLKAAQGRMPGKKPHPVETLDAIHGTFADDEAFREAMRLGHKWRQAENARVRNGRRRAKPR